MDTVDTVVILGAGGFIGTALTRHMAGRPDLRTIPLTRRECDLLDEGSLTSALEAIDGPFSAVLCGCINRHLEDSFNALYKNVAMVENFIRAAAPLPLKSVVYLSSTDVYGNAPACPVTEATEPRPEQYYGISKFANECILMHSGQLRCPVTALRLPGIYGPDDRGRSILGIFARRILAGEEITLYGDGSTLRDFVLVADLCAVIERLVRRPHHTVLNIATGRSHRLLDILEELARQCGRPLLLRRCPPGDRSHDLVFDTSTLRDLTGGLAMTPLESGLAMLLDSLAEEGRDKHNDSIAKAVRI